MFYTSDVADKTIFLIPLILYDGTLNLSPLCGMAGIAMFYNMYTGHYLVLDNGERKINCYLINYCKYYFPVFCFEEFLQARSIRTWIKMN